MQVTFLVLTASNLPLPVLVHAVDDVVPLLDDGDQLRHQLLLPRPVLLAPLFLWGGSQSHAAVTLMALMVHRGAVSQNALAGSASGVLFTHLACSGGISVHTPRPPASPPGSAAWPWKCERTYAITTTAKW